MSIEKFCMKGTTPNSAPHERLGRGSSANLSFFMMWGSKVFFSRVLLVAGYCDKNASLRQGEVVTYELVQGLLDCGDAVS
jgi:hypothetical protein